MWPCDDQVRHADDHVSADMHETDTTTTVVETTTEQTEDLIDVNDGEVQPRLPMSPPRPRSWQYLVRSREGNRADGAVKDGCVIHVLSVYA
jgi:hypothetical protein